uniref:(northern house mosquito) hypothetical protein n=1 Tax=Culex pipiens TaxID=7175 RepID=A0A8D8F1N1_CULPI
MPALPARRYQFAIRTSVRWTPTVQAGWLASVERARIRVSRRNHAPSMPFVPYRTHCRCVQCTACARKVTWAMPKNNACQYHQSSRDAVRTSNAQRPRRAATGRA